VKRLLALALAAVAAVAAATPTPAARRLPQLTFTATGDIALQPGPVEDYFASVKQDLRGDVVFGNLEGTLTDGGASKCGGGDPNCFAFRASPSYARALRDAGFTVLNLANNHALDFGAQGWRDTVAAVRRAGMITDGRPGEIAYAVAAGVRVAILGFAPYPWANDLLDVPAAEALVRKADRWADVVVVYMHAGAEGTSYEHVTGVRETFLGEDRGNPEAFAHAVVRAGADLVIGSGPHVLRGMEWYRGRLIAYSLGNFVGYHALAYSGDTAISAILHVTLRKDGTLASGSVTPVTLAAEGIPRPDGAQTALGLIRALSARDFGRRAMSLSAAGALTPPGG